MNSLSAIPPVASTRWYLTVVLCLCLRLRHLLLYVHHVAHSKNSTLVYRWIYHQFVAQILNVKSSLTVVHCVQLLGLLGVYLNECKERTSAVHIKILDFYVLFTRREVSCPTDTSRLLVKHSCFHFLRSWRIHSPVKLMRVNVISDVLFFLQRKDLRNLKNTK